MKIIAIALILGIAFIGFKLYSKNQQKEEIETPATLYKILSLEQWHESQEQENLVLPKNDKDFIHFSTEKQVEYVINKYYKEQPYVLLTIDTQKLSGAFKLEYNSKKTDRFYHLYNGFIPHEAVAESNVIE